MSNDAVDFSAFAYYSHTLSKKQTSLELCSVKEIFFFNLVCFKLLLTFFLKKTSKNKQHQNSSSVFLAMDLALRDHDLFQVEILILNIMILIYFNHHKLLWSIGRDVKRQLPERDYLQVLSI